jgi:hypothetical protein
LIADAFHRSAARVASVLRKSSQTKTQAGVWIFLRRLAASANTTDLAVNVRILLIEDRE